jgi:hypothetical protein
MQLRILQTNSPFQDIRAYASLGNVEAGIHLQMQLSKTRSDRTYIGET